MTLKELNEQLTPERIIELVYSLGGTTHIEKKDCIIFQTLCHNENPEEASLKLYYYKNSKLFTCYTHCSESFDIFGLFERRYNLLGIQYDFYRDIVLKVVDDLKKKNYVESFDYKSYETIYSDFHRHRPVINLKEYDSGILNCFIKYYTSEWLSDGISKAAMDRYNILYSISQNKIIIPHYNIDGKLIGIRGRSLNPEDLKIGKYMPISVGETTYSHPLGFNLYGINNVKDNLKKYKTAILVEGEKSVLLYETYYGSAANICVAACGSSIHRYQIEMLKKIGVNRIIIAFDKEGKNYKEKQKYYQKLKNYCLKFSSLCKMGFLWDYQKLLELKDSPLDKGKETFEKLLRSAIYV